MKKEKGYRISNSGNMESKAPNQYKDSGKPMVEKGDDLRSKPSNVKK